MSDKPLRSIQDIIRSDVLRISLILTVSLFIFTVWKEYDLIRYDYTPIEKEFLEKLHQDTDSLILQSELQDPEEIRVYYSQLKSNFKKINFCIGSDAPVYSDFNCKNHDFLFAKDKSLSSSLNIRFRDIQTHWGSILLRALLSFEVIMMVLVTLIFSITIYFRLKNLFSKPLIHFGSEIQKIQNGQRSYSDMTSNTTAEWNRVEHSLRELVKHIISQEAIVAQSARLDLAWQVAHDIRSPLTFLNMFAEKVDSIEEEQRAAILQATGRINKIAGDLLKIRKGEISASSSKISILQIADSIQKLVHEKKIEYELPESCKFVFSRDDSTTMLELPIEKDTLWRITSNILNNAIEALDTSSGLIKIRTTYNMGRVSIAIEDNGKGIPQEHISLIRNGEFSFGKVDGNGLGLHQAIKRIESLGGEISIASIEKKGTAVTIFLPAKLQEISVGFNH